MKRRDPAAGQRGLVKFFAVVERVGNRLPHPMWIFVILTVTTLLLSMAVSYTHLTLPTICSV